MWRTSILSCDLLLPLHLGWSFPSMLTEARRPSLRFSGFKLWKQLREPASTACLGSQPFCPYLIISVFPSVAADRFSFPVQQSVQRSDIKPTWFSAAAFGKTCFKNWMCAFVQYTYCKVLTCNNSSYLTFMFTEMLDRRLHFSRCLSVHGRSVTSYSLRSAECFKWGF